MDIRYQVECWVPVYSDWVKVENPYDTVEEALALIDRCRKQPNPNLIEQYKIIVIV